MSSSRPRPSRLALVLAVIGALLARPAPSATARQRRGAGIRRLRPSTGAVGSPDESIAPTKLVVGLGYIPSVQFAQFYLAQQKGYYTRRRPRRRVPEQDRPGPHPARRRGHDRRRHRRRDERHPGRQPGHPDRVRRDHLRQVPEHRLRQGVVGDQERGRPEGQEDRHPGQVRLGLGHAPGDARLGQADDRRRRDRRVPRLQPGGRGRAGRRRRRDRLRQQRADPARAARRRRRSSCTSTTITPLPGPGLIASTKTLDAKHDAIAAFVAATLQAMERDQGRPDGRAGRGDQGGPRARHRGETPGGDPRRDHRLVVGPGPGGRGLGAIDRDGWTASITYIGRSAWSRTRSRPTSSCARTCCRPATETQRAGRRDPDRRCLGSSEKGPHRGPD